MTRSEDIDKYDLAALVRIHIEKCKEYDLMLQTLTQAQAFGTHLIEENRRLQEEIVKKIEAANVANQGWQRALEHQGRLMEETEQLRERIRETHR